MEVAFALPMLFALVCCMLLIFGGLGYCLFYFIRDTERKYREKYPKK